MRRNVGLASMVHLKDFYIRAPDRSPGEACPGWLKTAAGNLLRGAILGQGDLDVREVVGLLKSSGYDGYVSIEFEGMEECLGATKQGLDFAKRAWSEA